MRSNALDKIAYALLVIGGLNWGLVGAFDFDLVATLFGEGSALSRIVYGLVGLAALYGVAALAGVFATDNHNRQAVKSE